ncbi:hypothetical protein RIF23_14245 [Lipingzhangella sp. LS1_29]|uniref:Uncharacterized protein n=1 Tax=Lipingzhangella rawalii TaxID=2055835 RepID=A0ABU2H9D0_9ACTN|nr:hypothetical protein [Lipingzhangella rawalii]MDS1271455.1 hypothetical protein [Lipingzhangella rawalii]
MGYLPHSGRPSPLPDSTGVELPPRPNAKAIVGVITALAVAGLAAVGGAALWLLATVEAEEDTEARAEAGEEPSPGSDRPTQPDSPTAAPEELTQVPPDLSGTWTGRMQQRTPDGAAASEWDLHLDLEGETPFASGELYEPDGTHMCDWDLTLTDVSDDELEFTVLATDVAGTCVGTVDIWLEPSGDELDAYVEAPWPQGISTASGVLTRH